MQANRRSWMENAGSKETKTEFERLYARAAVGGWLTVGVAPVEDPTITILAAP
jgi:hypothetical protein